MTGRNSGQGPKVYVVQMENDHSQWGWAMVLPNKKAAMSYAAKYAKVNSKKVVYLSQVDAWKYINYDATKYVVVCQQDSFYVGA